MRLLNAAVRRLLVPNWERYFIVLKPFDIAYARVPKAANTSIKLALHALLEGERRNVPGVNRDEFWRKFPDGRADLVSARELVRDHPSAFVFTFTRNPFSRIVSCYFDKLVFPGRPSTFYRRRGFTADMGFAAFLERVVTFDNQTIDKHLCGQTHILSHEGRLLPHFIGRVETMPEDWQRLAQEIAARGGPQLGRLRALHKTVHRRPPASEMFADAGLVRLVRERYRDDFERFYPDMDSPIDDTAETASQRRDRRSAVAGTGA